MRFLDVDLDFFLNDIPYGSGCDTGRLSSKYKRWSVSKVCRFLEERCGLLHNARLPGRTVESHDRVFDFWRTLIESGSLLVPFEVVHVDAHPDLWVGGGLHLTAGHLHLDPERRLAMVKREDVHPGNYLTFAIVCGWIASLVWVRLREELEDARWDGDPGFRLAHPNNRKNGDLPAPDLSSVERGPGVPFKILPWRRFRTSDMFDYIALSRSPNFTPVESDELIPVIEGYMRQI